MAKKFGTGFLVLIALLGAIYWFFTASNENYEVRLSEVPTAGLNEEAYLLRSVVDGKLVHSFSLETTHGLIPHRVILSEGTFRGGEGVFVKEVHTGGPLNNDDGTMAIVDGIDFHNGSIEVQLFGIVDPDASRLTKLISRAFIGLCFRVSADVEEFECLYLRPENGHAEDKTRRNHAVQYISSPDWDFQALRNQAPEMFEGSADIAPATWHRVRIEVNEQTASLFIDGKETPVLTVDNLKLDAQSRGSVALWVGPGTNGFFKNLTIVQQD